MTHFIKHSEDADPPLSPAFHFHNEEFKNKEIM